MNPIAIRRSFLKGMLALLAVLVCLGSFSRPAHAQILPSIKRIHSDLYNFDLRVPPITAVPINDLVIIIYGFFPNGIQDVVNTYANPLWGAPAVIYTPGWRAGDPRHPGYGMDRLEVRYGIGSPVNPGTWMHFGVHLRPCRFHVHIEAWWTSNGNRVARAWLCHIHKIRVRGGWLVRVANPRVWDPDFQERTLFAYGARYFRPAPTVPLPRLAQLLTDIKPEEFGAPMWTELQNGSEYPPSWELPPDAVATFRIPMLDDDPTPIIFQVALSEVMVPGPMPPNPDEAPTLFIGTDRPTHELDGDLDGDGAVGLLDFNNLFRPQFGQQSLDLIP